MIGEASGIAPDRGLNILHRVTMNTLMNLTETDLTQANYNNGNAESVTNTRLSANTPKGLLAGSVVKCSSTAGAVAKAVGGASEGALGVVINNAVGYPFESGSGVASGKCPYLCGSGSVFSTDLYETYRQDGTTALTFAAGNPLYASRNGLLTNYNESSANEVIGIVLIAPSASDPFMVVQMRI
jgi:hypothetical protein